MVDSEIRSKNSERYENLRVFLVKDSASINSTVVASAPLNFGRSHISLKTRAQGTLARLKGSLDKLKQTRDAAKKSKKESSLSSDSSPRVVIPGESKKNTGSTKEGNPPNSTSKKEPDAKKLEEKLIQLKKWHETGLITQEEYDAKRKALLEDY